MKNLHDRLIKRVLHQKSEAKAIIRHFTPPWMYEMLDFRSFKRSKTSYLSENLQEFFLDIVYTGRTKGGKKLEVVFLFEHKSYYDEGINDQLLRYLTEAYATQYANDKKRIPIFPIVIYHGKERWKRKRFSDNFDLPNEESRAFFPDFDYHLIDLSVITDEFLFQLETGYFMRSSFLLFKHFGDTNFLLEKTEEIFTFVRWELSKEEKRSVLNGLLVYIEHVFRLSQAEQQVFTKKIKQMQVGVDYVEGSIAHRYITKGMEKGIEKGREEGVLLNAITSFLAIHYGVKQLSVQDIAKYTKLPNKYLEVILAALKEKTTATAAEQIESNIFGSLKEKEMATLNSSLEVYFK